MAALPYCPPQVLDRNRRKYFGFAPSTAVNKLNGSTAMNDQQLLREYLDTGSERAFQDLVRRHVDMVYSTALRRLSDAGWAEEVTQNVFVALARKAPFLGRDVALAAWLHKTALLEDLPRLRAVLSTQRPLITACSMVVTEVILQ